MLIVLSYCEKEIERIKNLLRWMKELDDTLPTHRAMILASFNVPPETIKEVNSLGVAVFGECESIRQATRYEMGWPRACNAMFKTAYNAVRARYREPFFWIETDCVPLRSGWLDEFEQEYKQAGKPFMGCIATVPCRHLTGCAIYPWDIHKYNVAVLQADEKAWDCVNPEATLRHTHHTKLHCHIWGDYVRNIAPSFPTEKSMRIIPKEAALQHRCKDGSAIERLREQRSGKKTILQKLFA